MTLTTLNGIVRINVGPVPLRWVCVSNLIVDLNKDYVIVYGEDDDDEDDESDVDDDVKVDC